MPLVGSTRQRRDPALGIDGIRFGTGLEQLRHDPFSGQLFVFINKARDKIKVLYWERSGFCLWHKRLEKERFKWPEHLAGDVLTLDGQQLNWLLDGYDLAAMRPHRSLSYRSVL